MSDQQPPRPSSRGGIEGKWAAMADERTALREERDHLRAQVEQLLAEKRSREDMEAFGLGLNSDEQEAWDAVTFAFNRVVQEWGLRANGAEMAAAVHVIQGFILQHMLVRLSPPGRWGSWWGAKEVQND